MKRIFLTALVVAGLAATASAQQKAKGDNEFGVTAGYSASTVTTSNGDTNSKYRSGFNAGAYIDHYFSETWSLKVKAAYDQKGWNRGYISDGSMNMITNYHVDYITVPVLANWHFGRTKNWYLNFGPYVGFLLNAKETAAGNDVKDFFNSTDGGLDLGIGIKLPVSDKAKFFIELGGQAGVSDIAKNNSGPTIRNSTSHINIGFAF